MLSALGYLELAFLSSLALFSAYAVARRLELAHGAEQGLAACLIWNGLILLPIHVLGVASLLTKHSLALASVATSLFAFGLASHGRGIRAHLIETFRAMGEGARRGGRLALDTARAGPVSVAAFALFALALTWMTLVTWLRPSDSWDGIWYHDLMVGYAIQQHGYQTISLPLGNLIQQANGYPRHSEMTGLWFVIFTDRRLLELPSTLSTIPIVLATMLLCRRFAGGGAVTPFVWGVALVLLPGIRLQMGTTYVDDQFTAYLLAALYFCTLPSLDAHRGYLAALALALALGGKGMALLSVPPLAVIVLVKVAAHERLVGWRRTLACALFGGAFIILFGGFTYILNWFRFHNPFWPISVDLFGGKLSFSGPGGNLSSSLRDKMDVVANLLSVPVPGRDYADTLVTGYGLAVGFFLAPLAALASVVVFAKASWVVVVRAFERRARGVGHGLFTDDDRTLFNLAAVTGVTLLTVYKSPAIWGARYNGHAVGVAMMLVQWLSFRVWRSPHLAIAGAGLALVTNVMMWSWSEPGWGMSLAEAKRMLRLTPVERAATSPLLIAPSVRAREEELGPGTVTYWTDDCPFPSLLWNERFTNRIQYYPIGDPHAYVDAGEANGARWIVVGKGGAAHAVVRARGSVWSEVGPLHAHPELPVILYRRL